MTYKQDIDNPKKMHLQFGFLLKTGLTPSLFPLNFGTLNALFSKVHTFGTFDKLFCLSLDIFQEGGREVGYLVPKVLRNFSA